MNKMKKEYDFSKGKRGVFYKENTVLNIPIYLDPENLRFVLKIAEEKNLDTTFIVNKLIKENIKIAEVLK